MRVVITRAYGEAEEFINQLKQNNIDCFSFPCIEYDEPNDGYKALDDCIRKNHEYDWLIFLSKKSAEVFFERLISIGGQFHHLSPHLKIACVGDKTAKFIKNEIGFPVDFVPSKFNADFLVTEFKQKFSNTAQINSPRLLIPRQEEIDDDLKDRFESESNIEVNICAAYKVRCPNSEAGQIEELKTILNSNDQIILSFASAKTVENFAKSTQSIDFMTVAKNQKLKFLSIGNKTTESIRKIFGNLLDTETQSNSLIESNEASFDSMLESILQLC